MGGEATTRVLFPSPRKQQNRCHSGGTHLFRAGSLLRVATAHRFRQALHLIVQLPRARVSSALNHHRARIR